MTPHAALPPIREALQILLVSYMPLGSFLRALQREIRLQSAFSVQCKAVMEPAATAREGACDSYPFPEPTRPPASGKELHELLERSYDRPWDRCSDRLKEEYNNRAVQRMPIS